MKLFYERAMFALAAAHALLFLFFGSLTVIHIGSRPHAPLGPAVFFVFGLVAWRRAWKLRRERLLEVAVPSHAALPVSRQRHV